MLGRWPLGALTWGPVALALAACSTMPPPAATPPPREVTPVISSAKTPATTPAPSPSPSPDGSAAPSVSVPSAIPPPKWAALVADLARRGVSAAPVLVSVRDVTWPDGALGCPQPGIVYAQVLVEGLQVIVTAGGARYDYRFGRGDTPTLCV